jgi:hypothetical protein
LYNSSEEVRRASKPYKVEYTRPLIIVMSSITMYSSRRRGKEPPMANDREQFDAASFLADFDKSFDSKEPTASPEPQVETKEVATVATEQVEEPKDEELPEEETLVETEDDEELADVEVEAEDEEPAPAAPVNDPDVHKRNEAFKKLREEKEKLAESDKFLAELASNYGLSKEELVAKIREDQIAKQAKEKGIPVEQFQKMQQLEQEVATIKQRYLTETFNIEAERLVNKYNIPPAEVQQVFEKIGATGLDVLNNPKLLEVAYKAINYDVALQKGRQKQLEESKKRRETSVSPSLGTKGTNVDTSAADMDAEIDAFLKEKIGR